MEGGREEESDKEKDGKEEMAQQKGIREKDRGCRRREE